MSIPIGQSRITKPWTCTWLGGKAKSIPPSGARAVRPESPWKRCSLVAASSSLKVLPAITTFSTLSVGFAGVVLVLDSAGLGAAWALGGAGLVGWSQAQSEAHARVNTAVVSTLRAAMRRPRG